MAPSGCPHLILQAVAGPMAAATASTITNPMDVVRARVQVGTFAYIPQTNGTMHMITVLLCNYDKEFITQHFIRNVHIQTSDL